MTIKIDRCFECRFWDEDKHDFGNCRYNPPVVVASEGTTNTKAPETHKEGWCGKFERFDFNLHSGPPGSPTWRRVESQGKEDN